jgi:hypothetical protein
MSRLYAWLDSDTRKNRITSRGHEEILLRVNYGSSSDSRKLIDVRVYWPKGADKPEVFIEADTTKATIHTEAI